ncbi:MAG: undecaprenyl/decaprenyl-phosphate alpha-N-acetylglucosaminyl 1-phosphate transferase [Clostridia bacterium]|nr:undecaprenyl/decaprenyl-phosphate alpha-N-acetylglucosaminyl 1-phosphate transferase [Clostridia bacterium]
MFTHLSSAELLRSLFAFLCAIAVALAATPLVKKLAFRLGAIDVPKDARRMHKKPIPLWGGIAIYLGFIVSVLVFVKPDLELTGILIGASLIVILGAVDDRYALDAKVKFLVQIVAAVIPIACGLRIEVLSNFFGDDGSRIALSFLSIPLTLIWIVGVCNAVNLIDGLDGLACGVSTIAALSTFLVVVQHDDAVTAVVIAALAGACIGFLPYNFNPAKIFMGDSGALFLGFILATVSISGNFKMHTLINFGLPFVVLGLPIFDTVFAILRRVIHGKKPWEADRGHIHHKLIDMGMSQKQAVAVLYLISAVLGSSAVLLTNSNWIKILIMVGVLVISAAFAIKLYLLREAAAKKEQKEQPEK